MKKNKFIFALPFLFYFSFLWRLPIFSEASINLLDILLILAILTGIISIYKKNLFTDFKSYWLKNNFFISFLLILFAFGASLSWIMNFSTNNWTNGLGILKSFLILPILFSLFLVFFIKKNYFTFSDIFKYFFVSVSLLSFWGIINIITNSLTFDGRLKVFYDSPNHFAMILSPAIIFGIWLLFFNNKKFLEIKHAHLVIIALISLILNLIFTKSLGAITATLLSIFFIYLSKKESLEKLFKKTLLLLLFLSTIFVMNTSFFNNFFPADLHDSTGSRIAIYQSAKKLISDNFIWGIGPGNFQTKYLEYQKFFAPYPEWAIPHAHNNSLHIYVELGFLAVIAFLALIFLKLLSKKERSQEKILALSLLIYFLIHGIFDTTIWQNDTSFLFWFVFLLL